MRQRKATIARKEAQRRLAYMVADGVTYRHDPATIGHDRHTAECWTIVPEMVDSVPSDTVTRRTR